MLVPSRRFGFIRLSIDLVDEIARAGLNPCNRMIPLEVKVDFISRQAEIFGWHPEFDELHEPEVIPEYRAIFVDGRASPYLERVR